MASLIIPSTLLNLVNLDKAYATNSTVVINEIMINSTQEWIELYNTSSDTIVDISGWYFTSIDYAGSLYIIPNATQIAANGYLKLDLAGNKLRNDADDLTLLDNLSNTVYQITYGPNPWTQIIGAPSADKTIGKISDGSGLWHGNLIPSPASSNELANNNFPTTISSANVKAGANNPLNFINNASKNNAVIQAQLSAYRDSTITAYLVDNSGSMVNASIASQSGQTNQEVTLNASSLTDGLVETWIKIADSVSGIFTAYMQGTNGTKDTVNPDAPLAVSIPAGANNPTNFINYLTKSSVSVNVSLNQPSLTTDTVNVVLTNGATVSKNITGQNTNSVTVSAIDASSLNEGTVTVKAEVIDQARNSSGLFTGANASKDTVLPSSDSTLDAVYGPISWTDQINGTASDNTGGSGISVVSVNVQRNSDSKYWNGSDWQTNVVWLFADYNSGNWNRALSSSKLDNGVTYTVKSQASDLAGNMQDPTSSRSFVYDTTLPTGSFSINNDAVYSTSQSVTLRMTASSDTTQMQFSNDNINWSSWENFASTKTWNLSANDSNKTVYVRFKNNAGNISSIFSKIITLDTNAPTGTISINSGATYANNKSVSLTLAATDLTSGMDKMKFSNNGTTWSGWEAYNTTKTWDLLSTTYSTTNDGAKTVYAKFMDKAGNETSAVISDQIIYDATAPVNSTLSIDADATYTALGTVNLTLSATDVTSGMDKMMFSNDGTTWSTAEAYATTKTAWALTSGDGTKTIYVKFVDKAGNETLAISKSIIKDSTLPTATIAINNGANYTKSNNVTLNLTTSDATGVKSMAFSNNGVDFTAWEDYNASKTYLLPTNDGSKTVYAKFMDKANNISLIVSDTIILDTANPSDAIIVDTPNNGTVTKGNDVILSGTSEPNAQLTIRIYSDLAFTDYTNADSSGKWNYTVTSATLDKLAAGQHKITLAVTDNAGNSSNEVQIADFTLNDQPITSVTSTTPTQVVKEQPAETTPTGETEVETVGPENGDTKGENTDSKTSRTLVTLAILIIAIGAVSGGYYGYQWWMEKDSASKTKTAKKKTKKEEKFGRW